MTVIWCDIAKQLGWWWQMIVLIFQAEGGGWWWWWWKVPTTVDMMLKCVHFRSFCESSCNSSYVRILSTADLSDYAQSLIPIIFWLVVWKCLEHFLFFHILGIIIPTGELGRSTTNQFNIPIVPFAVFPPCHFFGAAWDDWDETAYGIFKSSFRSDKTMEKTMFNA